MGCTFFVYLVDLNLSSIFNIECNNDEISIFGLHKHFLLEIEPRDFLTTFLRLW